MLQWSNFQFMTIYHAGICSIWIKWLCIPRWTVLLISLLRYLNIILQSTKLTIRVMCANKVISPHTQKVENWDDSIMVFLLHHISKILKIEMRLLCYYFFNASDRRPFFSSILSLVAYFFARSFLFPLYFSFASCTLGCDAWCSTLCLDSWFCF